MNAFADRLVDLAGRIDKLGPRRRDPEQFHVEKDAIAHALRKLAGELGARTDLSAARGRFSAGDVVVAGRRIGAEVRRSRRTMSPRRDDAGLPEMELIWPRKGNSTT